MEIRGAINRNWKPKTSPIIDNVSIEIGIDLLLADDLWFPAALGFRFFLFFFVVCDVDFNEKPDCDG